MEGEFWIAGADQARLDGRYDVDRGILTVRGGELVPCTEVVDAGPPMQWVQRVDSGERYRIFGLLSDGTEVTLPDGLRGGCRHGPTGHEQNFRLLFALVGRHVTPFERYQACTVSSSSSWQPLIDSSGWNGMLHLPNRGDVHLAAVGGIRFDDLPELTHIEIERFLLAPLRGLLMLVSGQDAAPEALTLHSASGEAITVRRPRDLRVATTPTLLPVVPLNSIPMSGLTRWYDLADQLVPVTPLMAKAVVHRDYDVDVKTLILAASAEAIHRTLYDQKTMTRSEAKRVRDLAVAAVPEAVRSRVEAMLQHLRDLTYAERLNLLVARLETSLAEEITGPVFASQGGGSDQDPVTKKGRELWIDSVKDARNGFAHLARLSPTDIKSHGTQRHVLYESLRWMLTAVLLQHIGVTSQAISTGFHQSPSYRLFRERAVLSWPDIYLGVGPA